MENNDLEFHKENESHDTPLSDPALSDAVVDTAEPNPEQQSSSEDTAAKEAPKPITKAKKIRSILFRSVIITFLALILGLTLYRFNAKNLMGDQMPMPLGFGMSVVLSDSMYPTLKTDDFVFVIKEDTYKVRDIVVFQEGNSLTVHRIESIDGETAITKGDNNNTADDPIYLSQIKGKMLFSIPKLGFLLSALRNPLCVIVMAAGAFLLLERSFRSEKKQAKDELDALRQEIENLKQDS